MSESLIEEAAFQWTGKRIPYAQLAPHFVERIRGILEPVLHLDREAQLYRRRTTEAG